MYFAHKTLKHVISCFVLCLTFREYERISSTPILYTTGITDDAVEALKKEMKNKDFDCWECVLGGPGVALMSVA